MSRKRGVLAVGNFDSNVGYAWRLIEQLWCELADYTRAKGFSAYVCFPTISEIPSCLTEHHFEVEKLDFTKRSLRSIYEQVHFIWKNSIKVIYFTDFPTFSPRYFLFRLVGVNTIIIHDHAPGLRPPPSFLKRFLKSALNRTPLVSCTFCFAVSPYVEQRLTSVNCVPQSKVFCVTNGIDIGLQSVQSNRKAKNVRIVTVARASYNKGIDFAIRAVRTLVIDKRHTNIDYVLYGDGPDLEAFKELAKNLGLERHTSFPGAVNDVPERLKDCDIAFHPSKGEAMSLAILEYMRSGLPVVAPDNPSVSSLLVHDEYSLIYSEGSLEQAVKCLTALTTSSETRKRLGHQGRKTLEAEFSSTAMTKRFVAVLAKAVP